MTLIPYEAHAISEARPLDTNPAAVYLAKLSASGRRSMRSKLDSVARLMGHQDALTAPWWQLRYQHTQALRTRLADQYAVATANSILSAIRGVLRECWRLGLMDVEVYQRAADIPPIRGKSLAKGRALGADELRRLFDACATDPKRNRGARDAALLAILSYGGLRRSECVALDVSDWSHAEHRLTVRDGKGHKGREVFLPASAGELLAAWLDIPRGISTGPLLSPVDKCDRVQPRRLSDQAVQDVLHRLAHTAGVAEFEPHDLRRTMITRLLDAGIDIHTAATIAGHSSIQTTTRYDRRGDAARRRAADALSL